MAEWLGRGLQSLAHQFDSGRRLFGRALQAPTISLSREDSVHNANRLGEAAHGRRKRLLLAATTVAAAAGTVAGAASPSVSYHLFSVRSASWCKARTTPAWKEAMGGSVVRLSRSVSLTPLGLSTDGRAFFAEMYSKRFSGVVRVDARSSRYMPIRRFPDPQNDQAVGSFGGRWLVWQELHSLTNPADFTVWAWDARSVKSGRSERPSGGPRATSGTVRGEHPTCEMDMRPGPKARGLTASRTCTPTT